MTAAPDRTATAAPTADSAGREPSGDGVQVTEAAEGPDARLEYQPALDGIRALAVIAVMVYHQNHLNGGVFGVDVFFVLSGFLITSLLLVDHARTGRVVSLRFWARRARRLLPALFAFIALVALYSVVVAKPTERAGLRSSIIWTLLYVRNYWGINHLNATTGHMWSLSIEEQFYVVWPFLLALLVVVTRRRMTWLAVAALALAGSSAVLMATRYASSHTTGSSYFATDTRAQGLLIGAALGIALFGRKVRGVVLEIGGIVALAHLVLATLGLTRYKPAMYYGGFLVIALASALLITASVSEGSSRLRSFLSWRPLVWIGLISYGLYLYHVPLYEFVDAQHVVTSEPARVVMRFALSIAVASVSYLVLERPIRRGALSNRTLAVIAPIALVVVMVALVASTAHTRRATTLELQSVVFSRAKGATPPGSERVLVAGDSLASTFVSPALPDFTGGGIKGVVEWASHCDVIGGVVAVSPDSVTQRPPTCAFEDSYRGAVRSFDPDVSVLVLGPSTVFDRAVNGRVLEVGTPQFDRYLFSRLDAMRALLVANGSRFMLTTVPCMTPPTNGPYPGLSMLQRDKGRVNAINDALRAYAVQRHAAVADLGQFLCSHPEDLDVHGTGLNPAGQLAAWNLLATSVDEGHA